MSFFHRFSYFVLRRYIITDFDRMIALLDEDMQGPVYDFFVNYYKGFTEARGSRVKHHARVGGLRHHLLQMATLYSILYSIFSLLVAHRDYTISDGIVVIFLHDIEKLLKYTDQNDLDFYKGQYQSDPRIMLQGVVREFQIPLLPKHWDALKYIHGEGADYDPNRRVMSAFGALCHCADILSARIGHDLDERFRKIT